MFTLSASRLQKPRSKPVRVGRSPQHPLPASQARKPTSGAMHSPPLHRLTLIPRIAPSGALASRSGRVLQRHNAVRRNQAKKHSDQNRQIVIRSTCFVRLFVRWGPRLSPCPPQPLGAMLRASSRRPSGRFRSRKLVVLAPYSKRFFAALECVWIMTKPTKSAHAGSPSDRPWQGLTAPAPR